jgi:chemotaxis response regulator CheB
MQRDIAVIGASAGGVEALKTVSARLGAGFAGSVFVVLHMWAEAESMLAEILARASGLPTEQVATEKKQAVKKAMAPVAVGKVAKYDAATKTLTVTTKKGDENFTLTADTKITAGAKAAKEDDLVAGKNVKVAYTEAGGQMTVTKVTIAAPAAKKMEKTEKKEEPKK